jgi:hypothetical protein
VAELRGRELLREWQRLMNSIISAAGSVAGSSGLPKELVEPMQRQLELLQEVVEGERQLHRELAERVLGPFDTLFDLLQSTGETLGRQAEALEAAGAALEETAALMKQQAELFEKTVGGLRKPADIARSAAGVERRPKKRST